MRKTILTSELDLTVERWLATRPALGGTAKERRARYNRWQHRVMQEAQARAKKVPGPDFEALLAGLREGP